MTETAEMAMTLGRDGDVGRNPSRLTSGPISANRYSMGPGTKRPACWEPAEAAETSPPPGPEPMTPTGPVRSSLDDGMALLEVDVLLNQPVERQLLLSRRFLNHTPGRRHFL